MSNLEDIENENYWGVRGTPDSGIGKGAVPNRKLSSRVFLLMKKLYLALVVVGSFVGTSLTAMADEDQRDHDWNDQYWHHEHYGYWHGERGYWHTSHHKHEFIKVGPVTIEKGH